MPYECAWPTHNFGIYDEIISNDFYRLYAQINGLAASSAFGTRTGVRGGKWPLWGRNRPEKTQVDEDRVDVGPAYIAARKGSRGRLLATLKGLTQDSPMHHTARIPRGGLSLWPDSVGKALMHPNRPLNI